MNVCFRVDSSSKIGTGHVFRCLTLAEQLKEQGSKVVFVQKNEQGNLSEIIEEKGFDVLLLDIEKPLSEERDAEVFLDLIRERNFQFDWVIVDHYQLSSVWEERIRLALGVRIAVIDDLADRPHDCQLLLDQNYFESYHSRYQNLTTSDCKSFLGPQYLILRSEFYKNVLNENKENKNILIFFGGSDPTNETEKALLGLGSNDLSGWHVDVVVGLANTNRNRVEQLSNKIGATFHCQIDYLSTLMRQASFSLGAGGITMWERCFLGCPSFVTIVAENQRCSTMDAFKTGAIELLGWHEDVTKLDYEQAIARVQSDPRILLKMQQAGKKLIPNIQNKLHPFVAEIIKVL